MIRLFVGLSLPETVRDRLSEICGGVPNARWIKPENYHLTLRFLGDVEEGVAEDVDLALQTVAGPQFSFDIRGVGVFGKTGKARALWAGVAANDTLNRLQARIEQAVIRAGLPDETRRFSPHITLARLKAAPAGRIEQFLVDHAAFSAGSVTVNRFTLFSSFLSSSGAIYTPEVDYDLD